MRRRYSTALRAYLPLSAYIIGVKAGAAGGLSARVRRCSVTGRSLLRWRMTMSVKAYVLIVARPGKTREVVGMVRSVEGVREAHEVMGPYDIVAEVVVESLTEIPPILSDRIRGIDGVESTTSLVTFPE
ncbi:MAG: Lrp/AsnC family transcriptional regulator [Dehalococcoidia bacterium]|nr:Lrp/AsnC family transcriptional regulator [Dehalococcoidia bacterium]